MSVRVKRLVPVLAVWIMFSVLLLGSPAVRAAPRTVPAPAATATGKSDGKEGNAHGGAKGNSKDGMVTVHSRHRGPSR